MAVSLNDILLTGLQQGKTAVEIAIMLLNRMGQGFNECHRLVRTETMHYLNDATLQRYKDADVKYVQILAARDERTCDICGGNHEKRRKIRPREALSRDDALCRADRDAGRTVLRDLF